jgi:hypothetical protein
MTAVEWLYKNLLENPISNQDIEYNEAVFHNAKEMEKQQGYSEEDIKNAFLDGWELRDGDLPFPKAKNKWFEQFKNNRK